ncbi:MAG: hypothetical protein AAGC55_10170 [Myxococcota bacterium]
MPIDLDQGEQVPVRGEQLDHLVGAIGTGRTAHRVPRQRFARGDIADARGRDRAAGEVAKGLGRVDELWVFLFDFR